MSYLQAWLVADPASALPERREPRVCPSVSLIPWFKWGHWPGHGTWVSGEMGSPLSAKMCLSLAVDLTSFVTHFEWDVAKYPAKQPLVSVVDILAKVRGGSSLQGGRTSVTLIVWGHWGESTWPLDPGEAGRHFPGCQRQKAGWGSGHPGNRLMTTCPPIPLPKLLAQSRLTLCDPMDCCPPGSSVYGILQARILEWVAIPFSRGSSQPRDRTWVSCIVDRFFPISTQGNHMYLFQSEKWKSLSLSDSLRPHGLYSPWNSPGRNTSSKPTTRQDGFILQDTPLQGHSEPLGVLSPDPGVRSLCPPLKDADGEVSPSLTPLPPGWLLT